MDRRVEYKHNQMALLDPGMFEAVNYQGIINFLNRSRLHLALSANPYISLPYIQQFWDTVQQDTNVNPHVLRATVNNTDVAISVDTIRVALALGGENDDPSLPGNLIMGFFQMMGYIGRQNDTQARKGRLVGEWRYFMHVIIQCLSPRKAGQGFLMYPRFIQMILNHLIPNLSQHPQRLTLTPMTKRIFTHYTKVKQQNADLIPVPTPLFGHIINPDYVVPPNNNWFHPEVLAHDQDQQQQKQAHFQPQIEPQQQQAQVEPQPNVQQQVQQPVQQENTQENEPIDIHANVDVDMHDNPDLGLNMDDIQDDIVQSPIHEVEGNVVDTSTSDSIVLDADEPESDSSRDFSLGSYERLASFPLANAGKRVKPQAKKPRRKSTRDPPSGVVIGKRTLPDESSDSDDDFVPATKSQKLMAASIVAAASAQGVEDAKFVDSLLITPKPSQHTSPIITPASNVPAQSQVGRQVDVLLAADSKRELVIQYQSKQLLDMKLLFSKLAERLDAQGEMRLKDVCHNVEIQRKDDDVNDPSGNIEGDRQYVDVNPVSRVQGESKYASIEGSKKGSEANDEILLLEFFQNDSDIEDEVEKLECLDDIDELFDDLEDEILNTKVEEREIVEIEIEKSTAEVTYEGCDGLNVPYNFIKDDVCAGSKLLENWKSSS
ncbi:hypothetical protein L1987_80391 [Smallanthus sonchifolius]|uniref:Uncharacterized protein n=1 Tax=Smallanthus sonchifolius TaxID=185202 RepID=A0ACB8YLW1_9ASTR|nr:hypothetical protein L1987_80391 [Smallanthus sonchifolius]